jgi:hypothetical protein
MLGRPPPHVRRNRLLLAGCLVTAVALTLPLTACTQDQAAVTDPIDVTRLGGVLTDSVASQLDAQGRFKLAAIPTSDAVTIDAAEAARLATAWLHQIGPTVRENLEEEHEGPVDPLTLRPCGRTLYATSPFAPPADAPPPLRRAFGPWYLVPMCASSGRMQVAMAVSAWTQVRLDGERLKWPEGPKGMDFYWHGVPEGQTDAVPIGPEQAAILAADLARGRVAGTPRLIAPLWQEGTVLAARWEVPLAEPRPVTVGDRRENARRLYVGPTSARSRVGRVQHAKATQPAQVTMHVPAPGTASGAPATVAVRIPRRPDMPTAFETVAPASGGN